MKSETIGKLAEALCKVQSVIQRAKKDSTNPFFHSNYADLSSVWEVARKPLTDNGLSVAQLPGLCDGNKVMITTMLMHTSGEYIYSNFEMPYLKQDPQAVGSAVTYARRYALAAILGIVADEDDDANRAADKKNEQEVKKEPISKSVIKDPQAKVTDKQINMILSLLNGLGVKKVNYHQTCSELFPVPTPIQSFNELTMGQASYIIDKLMKIPKPDFMVEGP